MTIVIAEQQHGSLNRASWEAIAAAQHADAPVKVAILGRAVDDVASALATAASSMRTVGSRETRR